MTKLSVQLFSQFLDFAKHPFWSLRTLATGIPKPVLFQNEENNSYYNACVFLGSYWTDR